MQPVCGQTATQPPNGTDLYYLADSHLPAQKVKPLLQNNLTLIIEARSVMSINL